MHLYPQRALLQGAETELFKLVSYGTTPEQWAEWLRAPLEQAAARGNLALVTKLLKAGASGKAGWRGCRGRTLLDAAALGGNPDVVLALLQAGARPDVNVIAVSSRRSALYLAVACGHEGAARRLLAAGADVNFMDPADQCGPLHAAVDGGHDDLVADLLIAGACPSARNGEGGTPLYLAASKGNDKMVSWLLTTTADKNAVDDKYGHSPLMEACIKGHLSTVEIILAAGVDESIRSFEEEESVLDLAGRWGHVGILRALLKNGADVNAACRHGHTALHQAASHSGAGTVGVLLEAGAGIEMKTVGGETALFHAVHSGNSSSTQVVLALLRRGAKLNEPDHSGCTPLHLVCQEQHKNMVEVVDLLLRWGASETAVKEDGMTTPADTLVDYPVNEGKCSADEVERARMLLERAPADRSWRRRCWLVMLRFRAAEKGNIAQHGDEGSGGTEGGGELVPGDGEQSRQKGRRTGEEEDAKSTRTGRGGFVSGEGSLGGVVTALLGLDSQNVFRTIVGYL